MMHVHKNEPGFTLIELMISMMLGLIVIGGALSIYISSIKASSDVIKSARLNYDLDSVMQLMVNDIKRAGFSGGATVGADNLSSPFTEGAANIQIPNSSCILYAYDYDGDGLLDINGGAGVLGDQSEFFGFKEEGGVVKVRSSKIADNDCDGDGWESITDNKKVLITYLQFSFGSIAAQVAVANIHPALPALTATSRCLNYTEDSTVTNALACNPAPTAGDKIGQKRVVNIHLSGYVNGDNKVLKSLSTTVQVRNSRLYEAL